MASRIHIVVLPFPLQGHIAPTLHLVHSILTRPNVVVSFVTFESHAKALQGSKRQWYWQGIHANSELRVLSLPDSSEQRSQGEWTGEQGKWLADMDAVFAAFFANLKMEEPFKALLKELAEDKELPKISCILADAVSLWVHSAASELGIPRASVWTSSASFLAVYVNLHFLFQKGYIPLKGGKSNEQLVEGIPGLDNLLVTDLPFSVHKEDPRDPGFSISTMILSTLKADKFVLVNSSAQLEGDVLRHIKSEILPALLPVGPLVSVPLNEGSSDAGFWTQNRECIEWLDGKGENSTIYISFGSVSGFSFEEIESIALGVEASGHPFLWVLRTSLVPDMPSGFYSEFVERTREQGLVISWSPQAEVLSHKAVGAFLTHCGWNSCMESVVAGVPLLALPRFVDQNLNAKGLCDDWKVGKRLIPKGDLAGKGVLTKEKVEDGIRALLETDEGKVMRRRARAMKQSVEELHGRNGLNWLDTFFREF